MTAVTGRIGWKRGEWSPLYMRWTTVTGRRHRRDPWSNCPAARSEDALRSPLDGSSDSGNRVVRTRTSDDRGDTDVRMNRGRVIGVLAVFAMLVGACSSDRDDDPNASAEAGGDEGSGESDGEATP